MSPPLLDSRFSNVDGLLNEWMGEVHVKSCIATALVCGVRNDDAEETHQAKNVSKWKVLLHKAATHRFLARALAETAAEIACSGRALLILALNVCGHCRFARFRHSVFRPSETAGM